MPQIIFDLSTDFLTTAAHDLLPGNIHCSYANPDGSGTLKIVTELDLSAVTPIRGDDQDPETAKILALCAQRSGVALTYNTGNTFGYYGEKTPSAFLLVEGTIRVFDETDLDQSLTSESEIQIGTFLITGPLLFSVVITPGVDNKGFNLSLGFWDLFAEVIPGDPIASGISALRTALAVRSIPLSLSSLGLTDSLQILYAGIAVEPRQKDISRGARIGCDILGTPFAYNVWGEEWYEFFYLTPNMRIDPANGEHCGVFVSTELILSAVTHKLPSTVSKFYLGGPTVSRDGNSLDVRVTLIYPELDGTPFGSDVGDVVLSLTPSVAFVPSSDPLANGKLATVLSVKVCASFDSDAQFDAATILGLFVAAPVIEALSGAVLVPLMTLLTAVAAVSFVSVVNTVGTDYIGSQLGSLSLPSQCGPADASGCTICQLPIDFQIPPLGRIFLHSTDVQDDGILLVAGVSPDPAIRPLPAIGSLSNLTVGDWDYPSVACAGPQSDPRRKISFTNAGALPLQVCEVAQRIPSGSQIPEVLEVKATIFGSPMGEQNAGASAAAVVASGETYTAYVTARITGNAMYDQNQPPPLLLRILTSGGDRIIDLNANEKARSIDPKRQQRMTLIANLLCRILNWGERVQWPDRGWVDPAPFRPSDRIIEQISIASASPPVGYAVRALHAGGIPLAHAFSVGGKIALSVEAPQRLAGEEGTSLLTFDLVRAPTPIPHTKSGSTTNRHLRRYIYREAGSLDAGAPIIDARRFGDSLAVLTSSELMLGTVQRGGIGPWRRRPISATALDVVTGKLIVGSKDGISLYSPMLHRVWESEKAASTLAASNHTLWTSEGEDLVKWTQSGHAFHEDHRYHLQSVSQLMSSDMGVFALAGGWLWKANGERLQPCARFGRTLIRMGEQIAIQSEDGTFTFDADGNVLCAYSAHQRIGTAISFDHVAVELRRAAGRLVLHDRWETSLPD